MFKFFKKSDDSKNENDIVVERVTPPEADDIVVESAIPPITEEEEELYYGNTDEDFDDEDDIEMADEIDEEPSKKGFFTKIADGLAKTRMALNDKIDSVFKAFVKVDEELFEELEEALICADVGVNTSMYIIERLRDTVKERRITEGEQVKAAIKEIVSEILQTGNNQLVMEGSPAVILVIGVNGVGKTTSIGKLAAKLTEQGKKVILGAGDTFRAAAADQLQIWSERVGCDIIRLQEGADPAAVVFDTISAAKARGADVIIFDTAGRLHNKKNLMDELNKISRVIDRELPESSKEVLLVLDATTGQNAVSQVKQFKEAAGITGIILTKLDGTAKGGIVIAISHDEKIPVKFIGVGEGIDDMQPFDPTDFSMAVFGE